MQTPPNTVDALRERLAEIRSRSVPIRLGKRSQALLGQLLEDPRQAAVFSISELATRHGVNASTLSRLARSLGYENFSAFQDVFRRHVTDAGRFYSHQADRAREQDKGADASLAMAGSLIRQERDNLQTLLAGLKGRDLDAVTDLLANAQRVRIYGLRQSAPLASHFAYCLGMLRGFVSLLDTAGHGPAHGLAQLTAHDALMVYGFSPYTRETVNTAHIAASRGMRVVAVTDESRSPLAKAAHHALLAPNEASFFSNAMAPALVLNEVLLKIIAYKMGDDATRALKHREGLIAALETEFDS